MKGQAGKRQFDNRVPVSEEKLVLWLQDIVLQLHMPTKSTRKRRDVTPGGVFATDRLRLRSLSSWPRNWRCLEELSAMLTDRQGRGGRSGFPLCKHGTSSRQVSTRSDKEASEIHSASPILSTTLIPLRSWDVYLNLNTRAAAILLTARNRGFVEDLERVWGRECSEVVLRPQATASRSVDMFYQRARRTPEEWRDSYGIPGRRRSSNSVIKGQGVVREMARVSEWACISSISPM